MVFLLTSSIIGRIPKTPPFEIESQLYQMQYKKLTIENHFERDAVFKVTCDSYDEEQILNSMNSYKFKYEQKKIKEKMKFLRLKRQQNKKKVDKRMKKDKKVEAFQAVDLGFRFKSFSLRTNKLVVKAKSVAMLEIEFLPMVMGKQEAHIVFVDDEVGEMEYRVNAKVHLPISYHLGHHDRFFEKQEPIKIPILA